MARDREGDGRSDRRVAEPLLRPQGGVYLSPQMTAVFGTLFGLSILGAVFAIVIRVSPPENDRARSEGSSAAPSGQPRAANAPAPPKKKARVALPGPWRVADLEHDKSVVIERGQTSRKSLFEVLGEKGIATAQVYRILKALEPVRKFEKTGKKDRFAVAFDRATKRVRAFEYELNPGEIYQAKEGDDGLLTGQKLDMKLGEAEVVGAFYVSRDIAHAYQDAGFEDGILGALDDALSGHMSTESFEEGGTVRVIAVEETALGLFARYKRLIALEYRPPDPANKPVRIYTFNGQEAHGYWDERGRQPYAGGWRSPCPGAPITSRFNPKRMHPILHKIMPHQGTDFGAPAGTPVYSAYKGVVSFVGPHGATGNWVAIDHPGGIETGYAHLSRFAAGIKAGDKVGTHQLIGYVGSTGRSTGPHLHFSARKNGVFFDSETLRLDGDRAVPANDRGGFLAAKADLDRRLDSIALPEPPVDVPAPEPSASAAVAAQVDPPAKETKAGSSEKSPRHAALVGSPAALASAAAEPGIHPSQFQEAKGDDDDDDPAPAPSAAGGPKGAKRADPAEEDDEK